MGLRIALSTSGVTSPLFFFLAFMTGLLGASSTVADLPQCQWVLVQKTWRAESLQVSRLAKEEFRICSGTKQTPSPLRCDRGGVGSTEEPSATWGLMSG